MKAVSGLGLALMLMIVSSALAAVPSNMSYQGLLTDPAGVPVADGPYNLTFKIYDVALGGTALWTEVQNGVAVSRGGFSVVLGSATPINLLFGIKCWLGIAVGADPELAPRVELTASPYALSLRLPFFNSDSTLHLEDGHIDLGQPSTHARSSLVLDATSLAGGFLGTFTNPPGDFTTCALGSSGLNDGSGICNISGGPGAGLKYIDMNGSTGPGHDPRVRFVSDLNFIEFDTGKSGNAAVVLPAASVSSAEILDEPGISQGKLNGTVVIDISANMTDVVTTMITTPAPGYIVVDASGQAKLTGTTSQNLIGYQIDEAQGGGTDAAEQRVVGSDQAPNVASYYSAIAAKRTYFKSAGTYTFRLEAVKGGVVAGSASIGLATITATYYPTSYGSVQSLVSNGDEANLTRIQTPNSIDGNSVTETTGTLVDLRELELRAARAREQAERAALELTTAQVRVEHEQLLRLSQGRGRSASRAGGYGLARQAEVR